MQGSYRLEKMNPEAATGQRGDGTRNGKNGANARKAGKAKRGKPKDRDWRLTRRKKAQNLWP